MTVEPTQVLRVLAELADNRAPQREVRVDTTTFRWMPLSYAKLFEGASAHAEAGLTERRFPNDSMTKRILRTSRLRDDPGALRLGWMWVVGKDADQGEVLFPLVSMAVQTEAGDGLIDLVARMAKAGNPTLDVFPATEPELSELIDDRSVRDRLAKIPTGGRLFSIMASPFRLLDENASDPTAQPLIAELRRWGFAAAAAAGFETDIFEFVDRSLLTARNAPVSVVCGVGLYVAAAERRPSAVTTSATLMRWAGQPIADTAFAHVYADGPVSLRRRPTTSESDSAPPDADIATSLLLNPSQRAVVRASALQPLTVLSGPPGTGKSQTLAAIAFHHVRLGRSVLVTAASDAAVSALVALMESMPGPDPIVFGTSAHRIDIANHLADGGGPWFSDRQVEDAVQRAHAAHVERQRIIDSITRLLGGEQNTDADPAGLLLARQQTPGFFDVDADHVALDELRRTALASGGWLTRRRARRAVKELAQRSRSLDLLSTAQLSELLDVARARQHAAALESSGGLDLTSVWPQLIDADEQCRARSGEALQASTHHDDRADRSSRRAIAAVATALRAGRVRRREALGRVRGDELTEALPLWVATVRDIDDLLPMTPGLFDVVIVDEASHLDQIGAAPALLRARSAVVSGDPRQLRHVSFLAEERVTEALDAHDVTGSAVEAQLDVRRQSCFDAAAAVAPVAILDEHYRSAPHLIDFSARHFYDGQLGVATRHPRNELDDRIHTVRVSGSRDASGVNSAEVDQIMGRVAVDIARARKALDDGLPSRSVGVISPFRAQATALEAAALERFDLAEIDAVDLRIGTVHAFQGCERDVTYLSLAIDDESPRGSRSFLSERTLFNVMVTRARQKVVIVTSLTGTGGGLLADYLRHADDPSVSMPAAEPLRRWAHEVFEQIRAAGIEVQRGYLAGRHSIDVVVGSGEEALGIVCGVHPDGAEAHIERHLDLVRNGWSVIEVFESRWADRLAEFAIELSADIGTASA